MEYEELKRECKPFLFHQWGECSFAFSSRCRKSTAEHHFPILKGVTPPFVSGPLPPLFPLPIILLG